MKSVICLCLLFSIGFTACEEIDPTLTINYSPQNIAITIPAVPVAGTVAPKSPRIRLNLDSVLKANGAEGFEITSAKMQAYFWTITRPQGGNFDAFDSVKIYLQTLDSARTLVAGMINIPNGLTELNLSPKDIELASIIRQDFYYINEVTTSGPLTDTTGIDMDMTFRLRVTKK